jgi:hypothetical protein
LGEDFKVACIRRIPSSGTAAIVELGWVIRIIVSKGSKADFIAS